MKLEEFKSPTIDPVANAFAEGYLAAVKRYCMWSDEDEYLTYVNRAISAADQFTGYDPLAVLNPDETAPI